MASPVTTSAEDFHFKVTVLTREKILYQGVAENVTSTNDSGNFDVLKLHANFISIIKERLIVRETSGQTQEFGVSFGVMHVKDDDINVFLSTGETLSELVGKNV